MKHAFLHLHPKSHHSHDEVLAFGEGLARHDWHVTAVSGVKCADEYQGEPLVVQWGLRAHGPVTEVINSGGDAVIMETSYLEPRKPYCSVGFVGDEIGLNRRLKHFGPLEDPSRFATRFSGNLMAWRAPNRTQAKHALIMGQCPGDMALKGCENFFAWVREVARILRLKGVPHQFRPHPNMDPRKLVHMREKKRAEWRTCVHKDEFDTWSPWFGALDDGLEVQMSGTLRVALDEASHVITYNSNSGVDAVVSGIPAVTMDKGAMAWDVTGHEVDEILMPDRDKWLNALAWKQWTVDELKSGYCWDMICPPHLR